jgi:hypothetical protein
MGDLGQRHTSTHLMFRWFGLALMVPVLPPPWIQSNKGVPKDKGTRGTMRDEHNGTDGSPMARTRTSK